MNNINSQTTKGIPSKIKTGNCLKINNLHKYKQYTVRHFSYTLFFLFKITNISLSMF